MVGATGRPPPRPPPRLRACSSLNTRRGSTSGPRLLPPGPWEGGTLRSSPQGSGQCSGQSPLVIHPPGKLEGSRLVPHYQGTGTPRPSPPGEGALLVHHPEGRGHTGRPSSLDARGGSTLVPRYQGRGHTSSLTIRGGGTLRPSPPGEGHPSSLAPRRGGTPHPSPPR